MTSEQKLTRRSLLGSAAAGLAIPYIIPSGVLAAPGRPGANDRIVTAVIGCGGMGRNHILPDCAALCDVDDAMLAEGVKRVTRGTPFTTKDYRRILDRDDIDAVFIGAPDHWHALMTVHACQAGKHVYCEKPACRTFEEGQAMIRAARKYNRVVQVGAQGRSNRMAHAACQYVRNGMLGKVNRVEIWHENNWETKEYPRPTAPPASLDWEMWLGPAEWRAYHALIHPFHFRWYMDFGGGFVRDRGAHALSVMNWLLDNDNYRGLITCEVTGVRRQTDGIYDVPVGIDVVWEFPARGLTVTWTQPGVRKLNAPWGATYYGDRDSLVVAGGDGGCDTEQKAKEFKVPSGGVEVYLHPYPNDDATARHRQNFLDCIRTGKRPAMDIEPAVRVINLGNMANIAYRIGRKVTYNTETGRFVNDEGANRLLGEPGRGQWVLPTRI